MKNMSGMTRKFAAFTMILLPCSCDAFPEAMEGAGTLRLRLFKIAGLVGHTMSCLSQASRYLSDWIRSCQKCWQCYDYDDDKDGDSNKDKCYALDKDHDWDDEDVRCLSDDRSDCRLCWTGVLLKFWF